MDAKKNALTAVIAALALAALAAGLLWAFRPQEEAAVSPTSPAEASTKVPTEIQTETPTVTPTETPEETPYSGVIIEPPIFMAQGSHNIVIAEVLEITDEYMSLWSGEYTHKAACRLVYVYGYMGRVPEEFELYLTEDGLQLLDEAEILLCEPYQCREGTYCADRIAPISDGAVVFEDDRFDMSALLVINNEVNWLAEKRAAGEELSETQRLAPTKPLESGMTVEEMIAFFETWKVYYDQVNEDFAAREAGLYSDG